MPATTPNRGYPYPLDADPIDTAVDIEKLAKAIDLDVRGVGNGSIQASFPLVQQRAITGSNIPQGLTWLQGNLDLPSSPVHRVWMILLYYGFTGQAVASEYRLRAVKTSDNTDLAIGPPGYYPANEDHAGMFMANLLHAANAPNMVIGFKLEIFVQFANCHVNAVAVCHGLAVPSGAIP